MNTSTLWTTNVNQTIWNTNRNMAEHPSTTVRGRSTADRAVCVSHLLRDKRKNNVDHDRGCLFGARIGGLPRCAWRSLVLLLRSQGRIHPRRRLFGGGLSWKVRSARDRTIRTFQIRVRTQSEFRKFARIHQNFKFKVFRNVQHYFF